MRWAFLPSVAKRGPGEWFAAQAALRTNDERRPEILRYRHRHSSQLMTEPGGVVLVGSPKQSVVSLVPSETASVCDLELRAVASAVGLLEARVIWMQ